MMNKLPESTKRLMGNRRRSNKYLLLLLFLILLWFPGYFLYQYTLGLAGGKSASTVVKAKGSLHSWVDKLLGEKDVSLLEQQKADVLKENAVLKEQIRLSGVQFRNEDIKSIYNIVELEVIGNDNFLDTPLLYLFGGVDKGLRRGLPVLNEQGIFVGSIKESQAKLSTAILTPNHESRVGARIAGTDWNGILEGNRDLRAVLEMLPLDSQFKEGDQVVTDNRNPDIPAGILLGTVSLAKESDDHLFREAVLDLPFESKKLNKVWIITGRK